MDQAEPVILRSLTDEAVGERRQVIVGTSAAEAAGLKPLARGVCRR